MKDLQVTLVQFNQIWENKDLNIKKIDSIFKEIKQTDLVVLPEMLHTGFSMNTSLSEDFKNSEAISWLKEKAKSNQTAIYTSLMIKDAGKMLNRGLFIFPTGEIETYDKQKLFTLAKEDENYFPGYKSKVVQYLGWKINLQICYDLRFPEISRNYLNEDNLPNYDLSLYVANWPERRSHHWKSLLIARAIENQAFVVGVNRVGKDGNDLNYSGDSCALSPMGFHLFDSIPNKEFTQTISLKPKELIEIREKMNFLKDA